MGIITIVTNAKVNTPPVAHAGPDQTFGPPDTTITLSGSGTDIDGTIVSYQWVKTSGPSCSITDPTAATTTVTGLTANAVYVFQLTVTDNNAATGSDSVSITRQALPTFTPTWIVDPESGYCVQDEETEANNGYYTYGTLIKVSDDVDAFALDVNNNKCTDSFLPQDSKDNVFSDPDYIAPTLDEDACPLPPEESNVNIGYLSAGGPLGYAHVIIRYIDTLVEVLNEEVPQGPVRYFTIPSGYYEIEINASVETENYTVNINGHVMSSPSGVPVVFPEEFTPLDIRIVTS